MIFTLNLTLPLVTLVVDVSIVELPACFRKVDFEMGQNIQQLESVSVSIRAVIRFEFGWF